MKIIWIFSALLISFPPAVLADQDDSCDPLYEDPASLFKQVSIIGERDENGKLICKDTRRILDRAAEVGINLSDTDKKRMLACSGFVRCPNNPPHKRVASAGSTFRNDRIRSVRHLFIKGPNELEDGVSSCYFQNYVSSQKHFIEIQDPQKILVSANLGKFPLAERLVLKLKTPIADCTQPFDLDENEDRLQVTDEVIQLTHLQTRMPRNSGADGKQPIVTKCTVNKVFLPNGDSPTGYYTNCDCTEGCSGGMVLVRRGDKLIDKGMVTASNSENFDCHEYNHDGSDSKERVFTTVVGMDRGFVKMVKNPQTPLQVGVREGGPVGSSPTAGKEP